MLRLWGAPLGKMLFVCPCGFFPKPEKNGNFLLKWKKGLSLRLILNVKFKRKCMVITVNRETNHQEIDEMLLRLKPLKQFRSNMFLGKIKWGEDGLEYQKRIRNEWD